MIFANKLFVKTPTIVDSYLLSESDVRPFLECITLMRSPPPYPPRPCLLGTAVPENETPTSPTPCRPTASNAIFVVCSCISSMRRWRVGRTSMIVVITLSPPLWDLQTAGSSILTMNKCRLFNSVPFLPFYFYMGLHFLPGYLRYF